MGVLVTGGAGFIGSHMVLELLDAGEDVVVLDNLREGVLLADIYDPTLNPLYQHLLLHYGVVAMPCRVKDPDRKAYVSYCTLFVASNVESWLLGLAASLALNNSIGIQRFI